MNRDVQLRTASIFAQYRLEGRLVVPVIPCEVFANINFSEMFLGLDFAGYLECFGTQFYIDTTVVEDLGFSLDSDLEAIRRVGCELYFPYVSGGAIRGVIWTSFRTDAEDGRAAGGHRCVSRSRFEERKKKENKGKEGEGGDSKRRDAVAWREAAAHL